MRDRREITPVDLAAAFCPNPEAIVRELLGCVAVAMRLTNEFFFAANRACEPGARKECQPVVDRTGLARRLRAYPKPASEKGTVPFCSAPVFARAALGAKLGQSPAIFG
jgi:hypothetical protein